MDRRTPELAELIKTSRSVLSAFAKAKTAKIGMLMVTCIQGQKNRDEMLIVH